MPTRPTCNCCETQCFGRLARLVESRTHRANIRGGHSSQGMATIAILGTLDTKGAEHAFVAEQIRARGHQTLVIDVGSLGKPGIRPDVSRAEVAKAAEVDAGALSAKRDRGEAVAAVAKGAAVSL